MASIRRGTVNPSLRGMLELAVPRSTGWHHRVRARNLPLEQQPIMFRLSWIEVLIIVAVAAVVWITVVRRRL